MCLRTVRLQGPCVIEVANVLRLVTTGLRSYSELSVIQRCPYYRGRNSQRFGFHRITKQKHTSLAVTPSSEQRLMISKCVYSSPPESVMNTRKVHLNFSVSLLAEFCGHGVTCQLSHFTKKNV